MTKKTVITLLLITLAVSPIKAQDISTQGKEFWLSYMHNGFKDHDQSIGHWVKTQVLISAKRDCTGTISNPNGTWQQTFSVQADSITCINIPDLQCYHDGGNYEQIDNKGIKIVATDTISVFSTNIAHVSFDASFVLPTESLGDDYIIQTYDQSVREALMNDYVTHNQTSAFLIVATEDNTEIDITPTVNTLRGKPAGETFTITLNAGQTYQVRSHLGPSSRDLSGSRVTAHDCKKIAVFNGNTVTSVPTNLSNGFDHVYEQALPLHSWGKNFVVTSSTDRPCDYVKITSAYDDNVVTKNGASLTTLQAGESYTFKLTNSNESCFISASQISAVYLYHRSFEESDESYGDPSMVWIAPIEQRIDEATFSTFDHELIEIEKHYINIIVKTEDIDSVYFDEQLLPSSIFQTVNGNDEYSFASQQISHSVHHLRCDHGFNAHVYGFGYAKGYAYMVGSNAINLSTEILIDDEEMKPYETYQTCTSNAIEFLAKVNYQDYDLLWDFGDGQTSTENPVSHTYNNSQVYTAHLFISTDQAGCSSGESDTTQFYVNVGKEYNFKLDTIACEPFYIGSILYDSTGIYEVQTTTAQGCDSIFRLNLEMRPSAKLSDIIPDDTISSHFVIPATEFQVNSYKFSLFNKDQDCQWESVHWSLSDNCNWVCSPSSDEKSCEVYVLENTTDTVWLYCTVTHSCCDDTLGNTRNYWFLCSFYGIEDQSITESNFIITPNPNNGTMTLHLDGIEGEAQISVYDMTGLLIDKFSIKTANHHTYDYQLPMKSSGIYLFVINSKGKTATQKVRITQ